MQLEESNDELCQVKGAIEYHLKVMNRCKYRRKLVTLCTIVAKNWIGLTDLRQVTNFDQHAMGNLYLVIVLAVVMLTKLLAFYTAKVSIKNNLLLPYQVPTRLSNIAPLQQVSHNIVTL